MKNIFLLASLLMLFISACSSDSESGSAASAGRGNGGSDFGAGNEEIAMSVEGHKVSRRSISEYVITNTTLESIREVIVYSKVSAMVTERHFEEGDIVKQGDLLVKLHDDEIINNLEQSKIALTQTEVAIMQAEVNAELSAADFKRVKSLYDQQLISQQEYDQSEIARRSDTLSLDNVKRQLEAAKSRLAAAEIQVAYTTVKSPITGVVTARTVNIGDRLRSNQQLLTIQEFPPLWARIHIPEISIPKIKVGQLAKLQMEAYSERKFSGRIKLISPTVEAESGTIKVTIEVKKDTQLLRPGMFGTVYIATDSH
ncbi:MAG: efflux RND transporter periplasmic adaptor subunit, partial [Anaerolineales bacterium]|nr:efflux RND transporter periplasmic adaptor subunit [Anaerolineales bacterium]